MIAIANFAMANLNRNWASRCLIRQCVLDTGLAAWGKPTDWLPIKHKHKLADWLPINSKVSRVVLDTDVKMGMAHQPSVCEQLQYTVVG